MLFSWPGLFRAEKMTRCSVSFVCLFVLNVCESCYHHHHLGIKGFPQFSLMSHQLLLGNTICNSAWQDTTLCQSSGRWRRIWPKHLSSSWEESYWETTCEGEVLLEGKDKMGNFTCLAHFSATYIKQILKKYHNSPRSQTPSFDHIFTTKTLHILKLAFIFFNKSWICECFWISGNCISGG